MKIYDKKKEDAILTLRFGRSDSSVIRAFILSVLMFGMMFSCFAIGYLIGLLSRTIVACNVGVVG